MAGLLNRITKQILGTQRASAPKTSYTKGTPIKVKPIERPAANEWVKNSTISEPVESVDPVKSVELVIEQEIDESVMEADKAEVLDVSEAVEITAIDRTVKRERIKTDVEKEDYLLSQIDEFREKAKHLQDLLLSKESKVNELQTIVDEREVKAKELEEILNERQRRADGISAEVSKQIDNLIEKVSAKMEEIGTTIGADLKDGQKLSEEQVAQLRETLEAITEQLDTIKGELSEKVHTENVKCFRNISDLFKGMDEKIDAVKKDQEISMLKITSIHKCTIAIVVLTALNTFGVAVLALFQIFFR